MDITRILSLQDNITHLDDSRDYIVNTWTSVDEVVEILTRHEIDISLFRSTYAHPVLNYFIGVVQGQQAIGNCPVISKLLEYLQEKHISASELFIICINFRKAIIKNMFKKELMSEELYESISYVFDANFKGVLEAFNDTVLAAREESKRLYEISIRDHLTGLFNRKMFDEILDLELKNAKRNKTQLAIVLLDIDHFKNVNDTYGHDAGDSILIELSQLIQEQMRGTDILARWGGEEFVMLLPKSGKENSAIKAEKIRKLIQNHRFKNREAITCSFGITEFKIGDDETSIFYRADEALYNAKANGRNRISLS
ncbi:GGDEF domain-containing protein [Sulfurimonas sp. SAG-AH-194-I05]|nr:GGDEF domain-containing protein [Sulfurimonas sp. SAG-AH-194-I05]MDF1874449.1 GGDEF domain-containing protein [Sulfurimonas sp. SAG-AH-194-I05]